LARAGLPTPGSILELGKSGAETSRFYQGLRRVVAAWLKKELGLEVPEFNSRLKKHQEWLRQMSAGARGESAIYPIA